MKQRVGFVSNSSSASFILQKSKMTAEQIDAIRGLKCKDPGYDPDAFGETSYFIKAGGDHWSINEDAEFIRGSTIMDNDDLDAFLKQINLDPKAIVNWDGE